MSSNNDILLLLQTMNEKLETQDILINNILKTQNTIMNILSAQEQSTSAILKSQDAMSISCMNMDDHINFVNDTYVALKSPLQYITSKFSKTTLPEIQKN